MPHVCRLCQCMSCWIHSPPSDTDRSSFLQDDSGTEVEGYLEWIPNVVTEKDTAVGVTE